MRYLVLHDGKLAHSKKETSCTAPMIESSLACAAVSPTSLVGPPTAYVLRMSFSQSSALRFLERWCISSCGFSCQSVQGSNRARHLAQWSHCCSGYVLIAFETRTGSGYAFILMVMMIPLARLRVHSELTQSEFFRSVGCRSYNNFKWRSFTC